MSGFSYPAGQIPGSQTNDTAAAGFVGEIISSDLALGSATSLTTSTAKTITSITLTPGTWDITGSCYFNPVAGTTTITQGAGSVSTTDNTSDFTDGNLFNIRFATGTTLAGSFGGQYSGPIRVSIATNTIYYLVGLAAFAVSTCTAYGSIRATRVR